MRMIMGIVILAVFAPIVVLMLMSGVGVALLQVLGVSAALGFLLNLFRN